MSILVNPKSPQGKPTDTIDSILELVDEHLQTFCLDQRAEEALSSLLSIGAPSNSRLAYRPQPTVQQTPLPPYHTPLTEPTRDDVDNSLWSLISDAARVPWIRANIPPTRIFRVCEFQTDFLTYLDAYHCLPPDTHTARINSAAELVRELLGEFEMNVRDIMRAHDELDGWKRAVADNSVLNYYARLLLYRARMEGQSVGKLKDEIVQAKQLLGMPHDYDVWTCLQPWLDLVRLRLRVLEYSPSSAVAGMRGEEQREENSIVAVEEVTRPIDTQSDTLECGICYASDDAQMVLTVPCNHGFCKDCLHTWFHAFQGNSHTCPACRTELFSCPDRITDRRMSFGRSSATSAEDLLRTQEMQILQACESAFWLEEELELQSRIEAMCHPSERHSNDDRYSCVRFIESISKIILMSNDRAEL